MPFTFSCCTSCWTSWWHQDVCGCGAGKEGVASYQEKTAKYFFPRLPHKNTRTMCYSFYCTKSRLEILNACRELLSSLLTTAIRTVPAVALALYHACVCIVRKLPTGERRVVLHMLSLPNPSAAFFLSLAVRNTGKLKHSEITWNFVVWGGVFLFCFYNYFKRTVLKFLQFRIGWTAKWSKIGKGWLLLWSNLMVTE